MSSSIQALIKACKLEQIPYSIIDPHESILELQFGHHRHLASNTKLGLLSDAQWHVFRDKFTTYLLYKDIVPMPKTVMFVDPQVRDQYQAYATKDIDTISAEINQHLSYPIVVKSNQGTQGHHVYNCQSECDAILSLGHIWNKHHWLYDHVALAQEYIKPKTEYRVVVVDSKPQLIYPKPGKYPAKPLTGSSQKALEAFVAKIIKKRPIPYAGLDIIQAKDNSLWLLEINGSPVYSGYIREYGEDNVVALMQTLIGILRHRYQ
jgi:glutathione synthase/RimK-type ligase-like ATP-grasp enzyme